jgi:L-aspartate oxidase
MLKNDSATNSYDVIIAGSGVSGLYAALNLDPRLSVLIVSKRELELSNSALAQGGIAAVLDRDNDSSELHVKDTLIAGGYKNNTAAVDVLVDEGPGDVMNLISLGADFDRDSLGNLNLTLEGGHSRRRIAHHKDTSGLEMVQTLLAQVKKRPNITIADDAAILKISRLKDGFCVGILRGDSFYNACGSFCILATGGIGRVYKYTTNSKIATGDGIVFAHKLGAKVSNISLIQFHPTTFAGVDAHERFLISESVRGEGAVLLNCHGQRFMPDYDKRAELAPRDVVSHFIIEESKKTGSEKFYLDITAQDPEFIKNRFPAIYAKCLDEGIDITKDRIPVFPCHHYLMGGIDVNLNSQTSVEGLYAVGECSHTGVHGNNRLASNSLLEAVVFSRRAAAEISEKCLAGVDKPEKCAIFKLKGGKKIPSGLRSEVQSIVQESFFVNPDIPKALLGLARVNEIEHEIETGGYADGLDLLELTSLVEIAKFILTEVSQ